MDRQYQLQVVSINKTINRIAFARLHYLDGAASSSDFPLSNSDVFIPGKKVEILAGSTAEPISIFHGVVIKHSLKIRDKAAPQLVIECRHEATKLTIAPKNAYFYDSTDSDVISQILTDQSLTVDVESTSITHPALVQYSATNWDFLLSRAQANGLIILTNDDGIAVKSPAINTSPQIELAFGSTILEMDADIDARKQASTINSSSWDAAQQSEVSVEAEQDQFDEAGNLSCEDLATALGSNALNLHHFGISQEESQAWANAESRMQELSKIDGRIKCEGMAAVQPGDTVRLSGIGERFNGLAFVTGVNQTFDTVNGWKTHLQFGSHDEWAARKFPVSAPPASALLPAVSGLHIGVVVSNEDPDGEHRVQVRMPLVDAEGEGTWARVASLDAGDNRGFFFRPEIDDEVVLGFLNDDPRHAIVLGMLNSSAKPAPLEGSNDNHEKVLQTRSEMKLYFNDDTKVIKIETPGGNSILLSEEDQSIEIVDQNSNSVKMTTDGVTIESAKDLTLKAAMNIKIEAGANFDLKGSAQLKLEGGAGAELSSSAVTTVKGSLLQLN